MQDIPLHESSVFHLVSGLWKGERAPLQRARVLRSTNFRNDGLLDYSDVVELEVESRWFQERRLKPGDIIIERSGGGPKQPVGRIALFSPPDDQPYFTSNFTTALRVVDQSKFDPRYVALFLHSLYLAGATETLQRATTGIRNLDWREYLRYAVPKLPLQKQKAIAGLLGAMRSAYQIEDALIATLRELKHSAMHEMFTRGLRREQQKETELGRIPESWQVSNLGTICQLSTGTTPATKRADYYQGSIPFIKTSEIVNNRIAAATTHISEQAVEDYGLRIYPVGTVLMAMYGQGKTRGQVGLLELSASTTQNAAALQPNECLDAEFLWHFLLSIYERLRGMGSLGHLSHLNLGYLRELLIVRPSIPEQKEIASILNAVDRKIELHKERRAVLKSLFDSLLGKLMSGAIRVDKIDLSAMMKAA